MTHPSSVHSHENSSRRSFTVYALAVSLPLLLCVFWHSLNKSYPTGDSTSYISADMFAVQSIQKEGWKSAGLLYWCRGWKPILTPNLLIPFLLTSGDIRSAVALFNISAYAVFLFFLARLLSRFVSGPATVLSTWFIGTTPWVLLSSYYFLNEMPFMAAGTAAVFYLFENEHFASCRRSFLTGFFLALTFCFQPFVALLNVGAVYAYFVLKSGKFRPIDLIVTLIMAGFVVTTPWYFDFLGRPRLLWGLAGAWGAITALARGLASRRILSKNILLSNTVFLSVVLFAFAPFYEGLYHWAFATTYGEVATLAPPATLPVFLRNLLLAAGPGLLVSLVILTALGVWKYRRSQIIPHGLKTLAIVSGIIMLVPVSVAMTTHNSDLRYHYLGLTFLLIVCVVFIHRGVSQDIKPARYGLLLIGLGHGAWVIENMAGDPQGKILSQFYFSQKPYSGYYAQTFAPFMGVEGSRSLLARISNVIDLNRRIKIFPYVAGVEGLTEFPDFNIERFSLVSQDLGYKASYELPYEICNEPWKNTSAVWDALKSNYIIIGNFKKGGPLGKSWCGEYNLMVEKLIHLWKSDRLEEHGLSLMADLRSNDADTHFIILKIHRPALATS